MVKDRKLIVGLKSRTQELHLSSATLYSMAVTCHMWQFQINPNKIKWKFQFLSCTGHISNTQQPHVGSGYHIEKQKCNLHHTESSAGQCWSSNILGKGCPASREGWASGISQVKYKYSLGHPVSISLILHTPTLNLSFPSFLVFWKEMN